MKKLLAITLFLVACGSNNPKTAIGTPKKLGNIEIAENDFPNKMTWDEAKNACAKLGDGWRLPTKEELFNMYKNKDKIGGFATGPHWCSVEFVGYGESKMIPGFGSGSEEIYSKTKDLFVRVVRD